MKNVLIWILVVVLGVGLGIGAAAGVAALIRQINPDLFNITTPLRRRQAIPTPRFRQPDVPGRPGWNQWGPGMMGPGMRGDWDGSNTNPTGQRLAIDQAIQAATQYASGYGPNLLVVEVMEFTNNFYAAIREADTGRDAFEILIDPISGTVTPEPGPDMMWNLKYGMMGGRAGDNTVTLEQANGLAQKALDASEPGAKVEETGYTFYGYYTFDYTLNGKIAGMLSVNGVSGDVWPHTWHGQFISEKEVTK